MSLGNNSSVIVETVFGYSFFCFKPLVTVSEEGLFARGRFYSWAELKGFEFFYGVIAPPMGMPRAILIFSDGRKLKVDVSRFRGGREESMKVGFISGVTPAFSEFARIVRSKTGLGDPLQWGI